MKQEIPNKNKDNKFLVFMGLAFQMIAVIGLFAWIGQYLDNLYQNSQPILTLVFLLVGTMGSLWHIIRQVSKFEE